MMLADDCLVVVEADGVMMGWMYVDVDGMLRSTNKRCTSGVMA